MYWKVRNYLNQEGKFQSALPIVEKYDNAHQNDKKDKEIKILADLKNLNHPPEYDPLFAELNKVLGDSNLKLLGLCYSLTISNTVAHDEFGTDFFYRYRGHFGPSANNAGDRENPEYLVDRLPALRHELAEACVDYFRNLVKALQRSNTNCAAVGSTSTKPPFFEEQLMEAMHKMTSRLEQRHPGVDNIPLVACHPQIRAVQLHEFNAGRPIILIVRRIKIDPSGPSGLMYSLSDVRALYLEPDQDKGTYELSQTIAPDRKKEPCMVFNCWNTYQTGTSGTGLYAASSTEYFDALSRCDVSWLINATAAVHPPFACRGEEKSIDLRPEYVEICGENCRTFDYSRERCIGFNLKPQAPNDLRPTLFEEWMMTEQLALQHRFKNARQLPTGAHKKKCYKRVGYPVDFTLEHVEVFSLEQAEAYCRRLIRRHTEVGQPVIGQFVVRIANVGVSCTDETLANGLSELNNDKNKRQIYLSKYVNNEKFLTPL